MTDDRRESQSVALKTAQAFFQQVVVTRAWNAGHGGVYVPVTEATRPNPYLDDPLRDLTATNGLKLTKINPAYMTRQIAEIADAQKGIRFHITSLNPIRPENKATEWETAVLRSFAGGVGEYSDFFQDGPATIFRYMAPLFVKKSCLKCHANQGYREGDIRGGISVVLPFSLPALGTPLIIGHLVVAFCGFLLILTGALLLSRSRMMMLDSNERLTKEVAERVEAEKKIQQQNIELQEALGELRKAMSEVRTLSGFLPICSSCKKIRDDKGYWNQIEAYISEHSEAMFSHGICPGCLKEHFPEDYEAIYDKNGKIHE